MEFQLSKIKKNKYNQSNHKKTVDLMNVVYDEEFVSLLNSLSLYIKNFYSTTLNTIKDIDNNLLKIKYHIINSKCLINEINYNTKEKIKQLSEQIDKISNTKKILEQNLLVIDSNMNSFYDDSKMIFKNMKKVRNNRKNLAMDTSFNLEPNNSMTNLKTTFEKEDLFLSNNDSDNYYKKRNNSINNDYENRSSHSNIIFRRNNIIPLTRKSDVNHRYNLKLNYYNFGLNKRRDNLHNSNSSNNSFKRKKLFNSNNFRKVTSSSIRDSDTNKNYKNISKITLESSPDMSKTKSSFRNLYMNPKSIINKNNENNNILELSYKVIDFLSLLSIISNKNYSSNNPNMQNIIQNFEKTKTSLFELSTKYIEQNNNQSNKGLFQNYNNQTNNKSKVRRDLQLVLMNNNVTNIKKEMEYKELIDKINALTRNINNLERENKKLINLHNNSKKELINNTLLLYKKNDQLNLAKIENTQFIEQLNLLQKDNKALMELIYDKNNNNNNNDKTQNNFEKKEQNENLIKKYNNHINSLKNKYENELRNKDNEIKKLKEKIIELNNSLKYFNNMKDIIKEKDIIIDELKKNSINKKNNKYNNKENENKTMLSKNEFSNSDLVFEESNSFSYIINKNKKNNIKESKPQQKTKFNFNELILEQIDSFFYEIDKKNKEDNISDIILNNNKVDELENEISKLKDEINEVKNENINIKSLLKENKNKSNDNADKINKYIEEINNLKKENNQIIEEKNNIMDDYENMLLNNKNMEVTLEEKDKQIAILENNIKNLENQIKELENKNIGNSSDNMANNKNNYEINISQKLKPKNNKNDIDLDTDNDNEMISQLKEDLKEKDNQIEYLKIECQELKSKIEEYEENFNSSSCRTNNELNERSIDEKEKIKFLTERNNYYEKLSSDYKSEIQKLEKNNENLKKENEELKNNQKSDNTINNKNEIQNTNEKEKNMYNSENYIILCDKSYGDLKWYLLANKNTNINAFNHDSNDESINHNYENLFWVPKNNIVDIDNFNSYQNDDQNKSEDDKFTHKINKNDINININKVKEISFSSNVNNFSFHNSDECNKSRGNNNINNINEININPNLKRGSLFSLGNNNINNEDNNDYNKLLEKFKIILEKLNKTEDKYLQLQKKNSELKEKIRKSNKSNSNILKISVSDDSNNISNNNDIGKLSLIDNNFDGDNDALSKLNNNRNIREHEYYESIQIELDATKNQLAVIKQIFKELEKKFETVKQICENLFSKISLKKKEKEEFKILLKVMDFTDEKISLIIDKKKK